MTTGNPPLDAAAAAAAVRSHPEGATVALRVIVRAPRTVITGRHGDALRIRVAAPPVDGAANAELCAHLAERLGVRGAAVGVLSGHRGRDKVVLVAGMTPSEVVAALAG